MPLGHICRRAALLCNFNPIDLHQAPKTRHLLSGLHSAIVQVAFVVLNGQSKVCPSFSGMEIGRSKSADDRMNATQMMALSRAVRRIVRRFLGASL